MAPMVMPSNNSNAHKLEKDFPGRMGLLIGPGGWRSPKSLPYALDNGCFSVWRKGKPWKMEDFLKLLLKASNFDRKPLWCVVPDSVGNALETLWMWKNNAETVQRAIDCPLALAVQDGMTPAGVKKFIAESKSIPPEVIFVGGTTEWKRRTVWQWCRSFDRVHVGRVNYDKWLWQAHCAGAESTDGTGWFRGDKKQLEGLLNYLRKSVDVLPEQAELEYARTFGGEVPSKSCLGEST